MTPDPSAPRDGPGPGLSWLGRLLRRLIGPARSPSDPHVFHHVSLAALMAWVGLGADGLSSACYGPEEAYLALGRHHGLAVILALMTALTVLIISASYSQIIAAFPGGGGGYLVASKFLGSGLGLVAGCALVVDYVLTVAISIASATDAIFSFLPPSWDGLHLWTAGIGVALLVLLNLRGLRESIAVMAPVFFLFLLTHALVIGGTILPHGREVLAVGGRVLSEAHAGAAEMGTLGLLFVLLRAYSLGAGTYTGIEAVSNSLPVLREPRVRTALRTMLLMSISLAAIAGGLLLAYVFAGVEHVPGMTLNAVLLHRTFDAWPLGGGLVLAALLSEAALLGIAAQTGFVGGPQTLSVMAADRWVPRRFQHLSDRLVRANGVALMGLAALLTLVFTGGSVRLLVVLYSINVFVTFTLSQLGMLRHWWQVRGQSGNWRRGLALNGLGFALTAFILVVTVLVKFGQGGWATVLITGGMVAACLLVRRHYRRVEGLFRRLDAALADLPAEGVAMAGSPDPREPTAVILVGGYGGLGVHSLLSVIRHFGTQFKGFVFVSIGIVDSSRFKGPEEIEALRRDVARGLERYVLAARRMGLPAESLVSLGTDPVAEVERLAPEIRARFPRSVFFAGKLIFSRETLMTRLLHNQTADAVQRRLHPMGYPVMILPILAE